jgi:hypothetical protein
MTGKELFNKMHNGEYRDLSLENFVKLMQTVKWTSNGAKLQEEYPMDKDGKEIK